MFVDTVGLIQHDFALRAGTTQIIYTLYLNSNIQLDWLKLGQDPQNAVKEMKQNSIL
jgi:hypothetical protein